MPATAGVTAAGAAGRKEAGDGRMAEDNQKKWTTRLMGDKEAGTIGR